MPQDAHNATLVERRAVHEDLAVFRVKYSDHDVPAFEPGQFATLGLPDPSGDETSRPGRGPRLVRRAYSIASPATQTDALDFYIVRVDDGRLTPSLWDVTPGDTLYLNPKIGGRFTLEGLPTGDAAPTLVMVGTGTGLAPFRSMLLTYGGLPQAERRWHKFVLLDGCRLARDLGYHDELSALAAADERFVYLPTVTREPVDSGWSGYHGRVNALLEPTAFRDAAGVELDPASCHVYLCGNPSMIDQAEVDLEARGFVTRDHRHPDGTLHFERYW
ncbi:MAG: ferredoxin--NADP reductase [Planctomycetota bacterium]